MNEAIGAQAAIDTRSMSARQVIAVAIMVGLNALDGFDVLAISFAAPGIAAQWHIDRAALGLVLSMELIGMAVGSITLGRLADRAGRRPTILGCLIIMAIGMLLATRAANVAQLSAFRLFTGLGIGGMLAAINAAAAEYSNLRRRALCMALMVIGYPIGSVIGGTISSALLQGGDWRVVFEVGAVATIGCIPLVWALVPETPAWIEQHSGADALARANAALARLGQSAVAALAAPVADTARITLASLFAPAYRRTTLLITTAYFAHIISFYFILKWIPKIVVDMGFAPPLAGGVLVWASAGGATGGALFGLLARAVGLKRLTLVAMALSIIALIRFGGGSADLAQLGTLAFMAGMATNAAIVGLYSITAQAFPTPLRAAGTGFAIGVGRGGAALAPLLAGLLFEAGIGLQTVAIIMSAGSLVAAGAVALLTLRPADQPVP